MDLIMFTLLFIHLTNAEWIAITSQLFSSDLETKENIIISFLWEEDPKECSEKKVSLVLERNKNFLHKIPVYTLNEQTGEVEKTEQADIVKTVFYQDVDKQAALSLTERTNGGLDMRGSFVQGGILYSIEPYHPKIHKRAAEEGDHLILKKETNASHTTDYILPDSGTEQEAVLKESWRRFNQTSSSAKTFQMPATAYQVQLYVVVDSYLYAKLTSLSQTLQWSAGVDDFVTYFIGHLSNEIDIRYRGIQSNTLSISTVLSYIFIARTEASNPYSAGLVNTKTFQADAGSLLNGLSAWVARNKASLPTDADHFMLQTGLDLTYQGSNACAGLASVGGTCLNSPVSVCEFQSSNTAAHELGHNLGASHDGSGNTCNGKDLYVMAAVSSSTSGSTVGNPWKFSSCSINYIQAFIETLNSKGRNCLLNKGPPISSWENDSNSRLGQSIPAEQQCQNHYGSGYSFVGGAQYLEVTCNQLWCVELNTGSVSSKDAAYQYTTCGNKAWCIKERCVYDDNAPPVLNPSCPFGDRKGRLYSNSAKTCDTVTGADCYNSFVQSSCCVACNKFKTGMAGCEYGDKADYCVSLSSRNCALNGKTCCLKCCTNNCTKPGEPFTTPSRLSTNASTAVLMSSSTLAISVTSTKSTITTVRTSSASAVSKATSMAADISTTTINAATSSRPVTSADQQCQVLFGGGYTFVGGMQFTNDTCTSLWCIELATGRILSKGPASQYTTCGDKAWCVNRRCVYDVAAPTADPSCPHGDRKGRLYLISTLTCSTITGAACYSNHVQSECCASCRKFKLQQAGCEYGDKATWCAGQAYPYTCNSNAATCCASCHRYATPWLGPSCPYGDKSSWCSILAIKDCILNSRTCCQKCCSTNCTKPTESTIAISTIPANSSVIKKSTTETTQSTIRSNSSPSFGTSTSSKTVRKQVR